MKCKKLAALLVAMIMMLTFALPANAMSSDSYFKFSFGVSGDWSLDSYTSRRKDNATSSYINYTSGPQSLLVTVYGTQTLGIIKRVGNWYPGVEDCCYSYYTYPTVKVGQRGFIYQLVNERGYRNAVLGAKGANNSSNTGVWSPDSVSESGVYHLNSKR